jgi:hypothetical protein
MMPTCWYRQDDAQCGKTRDGASGSHSNRNYTSEAATTLSIGPIASFEMAGVGTAGQRQQLHKAQQRQHLQLKHNLIH